MWIFVKFKIRFLTDFLKYKIIYFPIGMPSFIGQEIPPTQDYVCVKCIMF